jgi:general stress protein YciG
LQKIGKKIGKSGALKWSQDWELNPEFRITKAELCRFNYPGEDRQKDRSFLLEIGARGGNRTHDSSMARMYVTTSITRASMF